MPKNRASRKNHKAIRILHLTLAIVDPRHSIKLLKIYSEYEVAMVFAMEKPIVSIAHGEKKDFKEFNHLILRILPKMGAKLDFESAAAGPVREMKRIRRAFYAREVKRNDL